MITITTATTKGIEEATLMEQLTFLGRSLRKSCGSCIGDPRPLARLRSHKFCTSTGITGVIFVIDYNNTGARIELTFWNGTHIAVTMNNSST